MTRKKPEPVAVAVVSKPGPQHLTQDDADLIKSVHLRFLEAVGAGAPLFTTKTVNLWDLFLQSIPTELRQTYTCNTCRAFVERYGGLVTISEDGAVVSALWKDGPGVFQHAVDVLADTVGRAKITGVFLSNEKIWGRPITGPWAHFSIAVPPAMVCRHRTLTPEQVAAEKREEYLMLGRGLREFSIETVREADRILQADHLYRSEAVSSISAWLRALHERLAGTKSKAKKDAIVWRAAATAPPGFCHIRTSMIGTLLEDISAGFSFEEVAERFGRKMHPLRYQRPTAAPAAGAIAQAEKLVDQLQTAGALARRFARLEDVQVKLWTPEPEPVDVPREGVFAAVHPRNRAEHRRAARKLETPPLTMTWVKFASTILPNALGVEFYAAPRSEPYIALVTAVDPAAPPIIQWDTEAHRNPVTWYLYDGGSTPEQFNLESGAWHEVTAITTLPSTWNSNLPAKHRGNGVILLLKNARDLRHVSGGLFFVSQLRSEYHGVRAVLEAYVKQSVLGGKEEATACGIDLRAGNGGWNHRVRVTTKDGVTTYKLDRWD